MRVGLAAVAAAAARAAAYPSRVSCGDALYDADSPVSMMGQDTALSASRTVQFERDGSAVACGGQYEAGAAYTARSSSTGGRRLFDLSGGAFDGGSCSGARTDQNGQSLTAPADGDMVLQAAWASGYGQRRDRGARARADRGADAGPAPAPSAAPVSSAPTAAPQPAPSAAPSPAPTTAPTTAAPSSSPSAAPSSSPSALPTVPPTASFLSITSVGTESTCASDVACEMRWVYRGDPGACATLSVVVTRADGTVVGSTTTANDGQQMQVTSADAEVSEYTLTLACEDDEAVADSYDFRSSFRPTSTPVAAPTPRSDGCADSTSWYWKKSKYDCDYVAKKSKRCKSKYADESEVISAVACPPRAASASPAPAPTLFPTDGDCEDSTSWYWKKSKYDCDYVAKKSKRCKSKYVHEESGVSSSKPPAACGECAAECADSTSWHYKKAKNTCGAHVSKKSKNCKKKDEAGIRADVACAATCGAC
ncbi:hypothetical protein JL722_2792 [Aureococcus anophagefferens]|nr:hypothetical protein JL722_2792 [Aureococcus anophagefferens]